LFLGLVAVKFGLGVLAWFAHINDGAGFGEVLIMIAVQAQIVYRRAETLTRAASRRVIASQTSQRDHVTTSV
jgi:type IV secretory pathway TrbD component